MTDCTRFEIDVERRRHGALAPDEVRALEAHLEECGACRRYEALTNGVEARMQATTMKITREVSWPELERRVERTLTRYRKALPRMAAALLVLVPLIGWVAGLAAGGLAAALGLVLLAGALATTRRIAREAAQAEAQRGEILAFYRAELDRRLRGTRVALVVELTIGAFLVTLVGLHLAGAVSLAMPSKLVVFNLVWGLAFLAAGVRRALVTLPRGVAERTSLG